MVAYRIDLSQIQQLDANSAVYNGGKLYVYENETTTLKSLFSDRDGLVSAANPIVADSSGRLPTRYVAATDLLTLTFKTSADVTVWSVDDFEPVVSTDLTQLSSYVARAGGNSNRMTGPDEWKEGAAITAATSIDLDAATGNTVHIAGATTINTMTLANGSVRILIFDSTPQLTHSSNLVLLGSANVTAAAGDIAVVFGEGAGVTRMISYTLANGKPLIEPAEILVAVGDETTAITTGNAKITFRMPFAMTLDALPRLSLTTASSSGVVTFDCNEAGVSIFSTAVSCDANETSSETAATPAVLSDTSLADNAVITIDCDAAGTNAAGAKLLLRGYRRNRS